MGSTRRGERGARTPRRVLGSALAGAIALGMALAACSPAPPQTGGYKPGIRPGLTQDRAEALLGKPAQAAPFVLGSINAFVMTYPFGQLLLQDGVVVSVTVAADPTYVGPVGIKLGMSEDEVRAAFHARKARRTGHRDSYDVVVGQTDTRTRDIYDETDHLMIEMAAANPNDPLAPFSVISISEADDSGLTLLSSITKAKVDGLYPDQHVYNYVSEPWAT